MRSGGPGATSRSHARRNAQLTSRADVGTEDPPERHRTVRHGPPRPRLHRSWARRIGLLLAVLLLWPIWSIGGALAAPGTDSTAARLAEWGRFNGLGWAVSALEQAQYQMNTPKVGGSLAGGIPRISGTQPAGSL